MIEGTVSLKCSRCNHCEVCKWVDLKMNGCDWFEEEPKTGHWIDSPNGYFTHCSECGLYGDKGIYKHYGWCPKCGAKMKGDTE